jgi:hypothetical protein
VLKYSAGDKTRLAAVSIVRIPRKPGVDEIMFRTRAVESTCEYLIETISLPSMKWLLDLLKGKWPVAQLMF